MDSLSEAGWSYRKTHMLSDIRVVRGAGETWERMKYVRRDRTVSEALYKERQYDRKWRYSTTMEIHGRNILTGEAVTRHVTVTHQSLLLRGDLEADALQTLDDVSPDVVVDRIMPVEGYRRR